jgi:hypothetical protein
VIGVFVPFNSANKGKRSAKVGWITDANGCDIWQGARCGGKYGVVGVAGRMYLVHRVRYEREIGPIPDGLDLDHFICDNGAGGCCNPLHCRPVTKRENNLRSNGAAAISAGKMRCPKGHPLVGENLDKGEFRRGHRNCVTCRRARKRAYMARYVAANRAAVNARQRTNYKARQRRARCTP